MATLCPTGICRDWRCRTKRSVVGAGIDTSVGMRLGHVVLTRVFATRLNSMNSCVIPECLAKVLRAADDLEAPTAYFNSAM